MTPRVLVVLTLAALARSASAQPVESLQLGIGRSGAGIQITSGVATPAAPRAQVRPSREIPLELVCAGLDCQQLTVAVIEQTGGGRTPVAATAADATRFTGRIPAGTTNRQLHITSAEVPGAAVGMALEVAPATPPGPVAARTLAECAPAAEAPPLSRPPHLVFVTPTGGVIGGYPERFTDDDVLEVRIVGPTAVVSNARAVRRSAIRPVRDVYIAGADQALPRFSLADEHCYRKSFVGDFQAGRAEVAIVQQDGGQEKTLGTFEFAVAATYTGIFSLGGVWTKLEDPSFAAVEGPGGAVVSEQGGKRFVYALLLTPFVQGARTVGAWGEHRDTRLRALSRHVNPTVGIVLNDVENNALLGVTLDLPRGILFTAGAHAGRVTRLDPSSGLSPGSTLAGVGASIPTSRAWETGFFWSVSVDLRAAAQLFALLASSANP